MVIVQFYTVDHSDQVDTVRTVWVENLQGMYAVYWWRPHHGPCTLH